MPTLMEIAKRSLTLTTHHILTLPIIVLMPHSKCNCRCVMCDIWKGNRNGQELSVDHISAQLNDIRRLNPKQVVLSGGEALMHKNLWHLCEALRSINPDIKITLLSTGLLLKKHAAEVVQWCDEVIVSLDGDEDTHNAIRRIPNAYQRLKEGIQALRSVDETFQVTARCVLQQMNYAKLPQIIDAARDLKLNQISFLGADVSTDAFNRPDLWDDSRAGDVRLAPQQVTEFREVLEHVINTYSDDFTNGFIAEDPEKLKRIVDYYAALNGDAPFPGVRCNAPWVSTVIEADGTVRPCFFQPAMGNIRENSLNHILNTQEAIEFRRQLDTTTDPICQKCVCSLHLSPRADL